MMIYMYIYMCVCVCMPVAWMKELSFPELEKAMDEAIEELGGAVCPKMNWSVPRVGK